MSEEAKFSNRSMIAMENYHHSFSKLLAKITLELCQDDSRMPPYIATEDDVFNAIKLIVKEDHIKVINK